MRKKPTAEQRKVLHQKHLTKKFAGKSNAELLQEFEMLDCCDRKPQRKREIHEELENRGYRIKIIYSLEKTEPPLRE